MAGSLQIANGRNTGDARGLARGAHDGVGHDVRGERADLAGIGEAAAPVASVKMTSPSPGVCDGRQRAGVAVVRHLRHAGRLGLRQARVGGDDTERGVLPASRRSGARRHAAVFLASANAFAVSRAHAGDHLAGCRIDHVAGRVDDDERGDDQPVWQA